MPKLVSASYSRRHFLALTSAAATLSTLPLKANAASDFTLRVAPGRARFTPGSTVETAVWSYNQRFPARSYVYVRATELESLLKTSSRKKRLCIGMAYACQTLWMAFQS